MGTRNEGETWRDSEKKKKRARERRTKTPQSPAVDEKNSIHQIRATTGSSEYMKNIKNLDTILDLRSSFGGGPYAHPQNRKLNSD